MKLNGCGGFLIFVVALFIGLVMLGKWAGGDMDRRVSSGAASSPSEFSRYCVAGLVDLGRERSGWAGARASIGEPIVLSSTPPQRIACAATARSGERLYFTVDIRCGDVNARACVVAMPARSG